MLVSPVGNYSQAKQKNLSFGMNGEEAIEVLAKLNSITGPCMERTKELLTKSKIPALAAYGQLLQEMGDSYARTLKLPANEAERGERLAKKKLFDILINLYREKIDCEEHPDNCAEFLKQYIPYFNDLLKPTGSPKK